MQRWLSRRAFGALVGVLVLGISMPSFTASGSYSYLKSNSTWNVNQTWMDVRN